MLSSSGVNRHPGHMSKSLPQEERDSVYLALQSVHLRERAEATSGFVVRVHGYASQLKYV